MGIVNVTPDSFSDGGLALDPAAAVARAMRMVADGAAIIDIGGESTRPGAEEIPAAEEMRRVLPVIRELSGCSPVTISIDTQKAEVARAALEAGAHIVNDVSACTHDPAMADVVLGHDAGVVLMHMRGSPRTMQADPRYGDVVGEVHDYLAERLSALRDKGIRQDAMAVDPGIGFGKTIEHNLALLAGIPRLVALGVPVVIGLSRKSFLGHLTGRPVDGRLAGSLAGAVVSALRGAQVLRVHDVGETVDALKVAAALAGGPHPSRL